MRKETYICDECGAERGETNHWFSLSTRLFQYGGPASMKEEGFFLFPWDGEARGQVHLCGQGCVHAVLDRFMSTGKVEKIKVEREEPIG